MFILFAFGLFVGAAVGAYFMNRKKTREIVQLRLAICRERRWVFYDNKLVVHHNGQTHEIPMTAIWDAFKDAKVKMFGLSYEDVMALRQLRRSVLEEATARPCDGP